MPKQYCTHLPLPLPMAFALFASPKQASAMPARPTPNFFSAARRVTDWARLFASSSNWLFMIFLSLLVYVSVDCLFREKTFQRSRLRRRPGRVVVVGGEVSHDLVLVLFFGFGHRMALGRHGP